MSTTKLLLLIVALSATGSVSAQGSSGAPQWTYVEGGFTDYTPNSGDSDSGGFVGGSIGIFKSFHLIGEYNWAGDYSIWEAGGGWHGLFGESLDMFAQVTWTDVAFDSASDFSDDGAKVAGGVRWILGKRFEIKGTASWVDLDDSDVTFKAEGLWFLMQNRLGLGVSWEIGDSDTAHIFARWNFGQ